MFIIHSSLTVRDISIITVLTALCVGWNYALIGLPNINIMELVVFVTGFIFGVPIGATTGVLVWAVYGAINPLGLNIPV